MKYILTAVVAAAAVVAELLLYLLVPHAGALCKNQVSLIPSYFVCALLGDWFAMKDER